MPEAKLRHFRHSKYFFIEPPDLKIKEAFFIFLKKRKQTARIRSKKTKFGINLTNLAFFKTRISSKANDKFCCWELYC